MELARSRKTKAPVKQFLYKSTYLVWISRIATFSEIHLNFRWFNLPGIAIWGQ